MRKIVEWSMKCILIQWSFFVVVIIFCLLYCFTQIKKQEDKRKYLLMENTLLKETILKQYGHSYKMNDLKLFDDKRELYLSDILGDEYKLIVWFSELHCSSCVDFVLNELQILEKEGFDSKPIVIGSFRNMRSYLQFIENRKTSFQVYGELEILLKREDKEDMPSMFLLNRNNEMKCLFYPLKEIPFLMRSYIEIINKQL